MADRFWVGGTGTWDTTNTANWSASSGGASGASVPTAADNVFFDQAGTYTVTMTGALLCLDITVSAGTVTFATGTSPTLAVKGSMTLLAGTVWSSTGAITFNATTTGKTITTNGVSISGRVLLQGSGGEWTLGSAFTNTGSLGFDVLTGTFNTGNYNLTTVSFDSGGATGTRTVNLGSSTITCTESGANAFSVQSATNLTFNAGTSTIILSGNTSSGISVGTRTTTFYNVTFTGTGGGTRSLDGRITFNNLSIAASSTAGITTVNFTTFSGGIPSITVNGTLSTTGTAGNRRVFFTSSTYGISYDMVVNATPSLTDADFRGLYVTGTASPISGTRIGNRGECRGITFSAPKTVYWSQAAGGNWSGNNWASSSGGVPSTDYFPLAQDIATFVNTGLNTSATVTWDNVIIYTGSVDMSGRTNAMTLATGTVLPVVYGNWTNGSGTTISGISTITFSGGNTHTITSAGKAFTQPITVDTYGGTVQLAGTLSISGNTLTVTNGTFDTKNYNVSASSLSSSNSNVRTLTLGSSTLTFTTAGTALNFTTNTNLTFNAGTSQITLSSTGVNFNASGQTFYNVSFTTTSASTHVINGANTFNNLTITAPVSAGLMQCSFSANQTINGTLTCAGASAVRRIFLQSNTLDIQRDLTVGTLVANDCDFRDIDILGSAAGTAPTRAGDCGGNANITFPAAKTVYWNLAGAQNWSATGWCPSSGGTPDINQFPLAQDTAVFDDAGSVTGTITINTIWNIGTFDASARTSAMTLSASFSPTINGDWKFGTGVTSSSATGILTFSKPGTQTITSNGVQFGCNITVNRAAANVQLADALSIGSTRTLTLTAGTFDAVTYNVTTGLFSNGATTNTLKMGSGTWTLSGTGTVWSCATAPTLVAGTSTIILSDTSTSSRTFNGGSLYYNKLTIGGATGTSTLTIIGSNTFGELASTKTVAHTITLTSLTTTTIGKWSVTGTSGNVVTLAPSTAATAYTISIAGPANSGIDYLSISYCTLSTTSPGEFYVGVNSTNTAGNTRVTFTATPAARTLYWVGGTGNWSSTTKWSTSSGGGSGAAIPTSLDAVNFDSASNATAYTATIDAGVTIARCASFTMAGPASGNVTFAGTVGIAFHGNVSFAATGITRTYTGIMNWAGNSSYTFTTNGLTLESATTVNGINSTWTLGSTLNNGTQTLTVTYGTFTTNNFNFSVTQFLTIVASIRTINLGSSTVTITASGSNAANFTPSTNLTFNAGTSQINFSGSPSGFTSTGITFYNVSFTSNSASALTITGANTFNNLTFTGRTTVGINAVTFSADQTINGTLTLGAGTAAAYRTFLASNSLNTTRTLTVNSLAAGAADIDFRDITIAGAAAPISGTRFGDAKGNSGITFPAAKTVYYRQTGSASWGTTGTGSWSATSGGAADATQFPLAQDTAIFPAATYPASGSTTTINAEYNIGTIDMSLRTTNTMTLATSTLNLYVYGNWINGTGTTLSGTGFFFFAGRGAQTITSAGKTFTQQFSIATLSGSVTLQDAITISTIATGLTLNVGTFDAATYNVTLLSSANLQTAGTAAKTLAIGSGTWTVDASGVSAWNTGGSNTTVTGTGTISLTSVSSKTFNGNNLSYSGITLNQGGAGTLTITGNNTFKDITNTYSATGAATISLGSTTQTLTQFTGTGAAAKLLTLSGTSAASSGTLILSSGVVSTPDYLSISNVRAYSLNTTWYAGANSTNLGSMGWYFQAYSPGGAYTITAINGTYALTGQPATLLRSKLVTANNGSYSLTGQSADLAKGRVLEPSYGSYTVTGQSADLAKGRVLEPSYGSYTVTGQSATLTKGKLLQLLYGTYSLTGQSADLIRSRVLEPSYGSYTVTGQSADLIRSRVLEPSYGSYTVIGQSADLIRGRVLQPSYGSYTVTGQSADLIRGRVLEPSYGSYTVDGQLANIAKGRVLEPFYGSYTVTGQNATIAIGQLWNLIPTDQPVIWSNLNTTQDGGWITFPTTDPYELEYVTTVPASFSASTYTLTDVNFGDAADSREIFVVLTGRYSGTRSISSMTIGGVAATIATTNYLTSSTLGQAIAFATVPTGTSGTVVINWSGTVFAMQLAVYRVTGRPRLGSNIYSSGNVPATTNASSLTIAAGATTVPRDGFLIGSVATLGLPPATGTTVGMTQVGGDTYPSTSAIFPSTIALTNNRIGLTADSSSRSITWPSTQFVSTLAVWTFR